MAFSDGQITRLRTRLLYYRELQGRRELGADLPWKTIAGRIVSMTDVDVSHERLRQFVDGVPVEPRSKEKRYPVLQQHGLEAVRDFLMHDNVGYLGTHEMDPEPSAHYAAFSLSDYMNGAARDVDAIPKGDFVRVFDEDGVIVESRLYVGGAPESAVLIVAETEHRYRISSPKPFSRWADSDRRFFRIQKRALTGWAVPGAAGSLLVFLASADDGKFSHTYLGLNLTGPSDDRLSLLRYPLAVPEYDKGSGQAVADSNETDPRLAAGLAFSVVFFERDRTGATFTPGASR